MSQDLKEPLRGIEAFSGFLVEDYAEKLDEQGQRYLAALRDSAVRMRDLIDDLLQLSRIGRAKPQLEEVSVGTLLEEVSRSMAFALTEKRAELRLAGALPAIVCDPVRMRQVFENLISNAVKYNDKPRPVIEIGCREDEEAYTFYVRDNGAGVDQRYHEKIFRIFQRLVLREEHEGTGVGLTICKKIIEAHGDGDERLSAVVDSFDALTSDRPYRSALSVEETVRRLTEGAGSQWDSAIVAVFVRLVRDKKLQAASERQVLAEPPASATRR